MLRTLLLIHAQDNRTFTMSDNGQSAYVLLYLSSGSSLLEKQGMQDAVIAIERVPGAWLDGHSLGQSAATSLGSWERLLLLSIKWHGNRSW